MYRNGIKKNATTFLIVISLILISLTIIIKTNSIKPINVNALEDEYTAINDDFDSFINVEPFASDNKDKEEPDGIINIAGPEERNKKVDVHRPIGDFTSVKYIENSNYFLLNPQHGKNDGSDVEKGTCTTVAMQMLMGYHNYYSDRRLIPEVSTSGVRFLSTDYGDFTNHPNLKRNYVIKQGCPSIGTENTVYKELLNLNGWTHLDIFGQITGFVKDSAVKFVKTHASSIKDNVKMDSGFFNKSKAKSDIDAGRPILLVTDGWSNDWFFHVVPAYGYATLDGVEGFIVHFGWGDYRRHAWLPSDLFEYQITMSVNHTHNFADTGTTVNDFYRGLSCTTCGATTVDNFYTNLGNTITGVKYPFFGNVTVPEAITKYTNGAFVNQPIEIIGPSAFYEQSNITAIEISTNIVSIGKGAFENCNNIESITLPFIGAGLNDTTNMHFAYIFGNVPPSLTSVTTTGGTRIADYALMVVVT